jgi:hypothetical protein
MRKSCARIDVRKDRLGLHLVNEYRQQYFLYAKPLMTMVTWPEEYARVKLRNAPQKPAIGYPAGDVWGVFESGEDEITITLLIGPRDLNIELNRQTQEPENVVAGQTYILPNEEFDMLYQALELMVHQKEEFQDLLDGAETSIDF